MGDLGKLFGVKGFNKLPKVPKIAQSGHTDLNMKKSEPNVLKIAMF